MSPLTHAEASRLIMRAGCSYEVANLAEWAFAHRDTSLISDARGYFMRAGGTDREWSQIAEALGSPVLV